MYKEFMDEKAHQMFKRLCNRIVNREFDEDDIYEFYIFIRSYLKRFKGKYKWIREWGDLIAHRERVEGAVLKNMKNAISNSYEVIEGTNQIKGYHGMEEGELEKEFSDLFREAGYTVSMQALKEIKLCTFSIANFSRYKISDKPGRTGQVRLVQTQSGLALCSHAGERDDFYIGLSILKGNYIDKDFPCGFIDKPIEVRRKNKELVILYDGDEV